MIQWMMLLSLIFIIAMLVARVTEHKRLYMYGVFVCIVVGVCCYYIH